MDWYSRKTGSPHFWIRREVNFCLVRCRKRAAKRMTRTNCTAARLKRQDPRILFGRGPPRESSMAMIQRNGKRVSTLLCRKRTPMCEPIVHRVGGFILREFCKLHSEKRRRETRSEERRVGKECKCRWARWHYKKKCMSTKERGHGTSDADSRRRH